MEMFTFTKGDVVKTCHCHEGVRDWTKEEGVTVWKAKKHGKETLKALRKEIRDGHGT